MTTTVAQTGLTPQQWDDMFYTSYVRANPFYPYMGTGEMDMIQVKSDLTKKNGDSVTYALVNDLVGAGVTGNTALIGAEEALMSRSFKVSVNLFRHAVTIHEWDEQKSAIDLRNAAKAQLRSWSVKKLRTDVLNAMASINGIPYQTGNGDGTAGSSEAQKDAWLVDNADRVLFGASVSNNGSNDHSAALGNIDNTNDKLNAALVRLAKRRAKLASPAIRPIELKSGEEWFVLFAHSLAFRDLKADLATIHADAEVRGKDNPLFHDNDLVYDGVIIREVPEIAVEGNTGAGSIQVVPNYMCGAQAIAMAVAQRSTTRTDVTDYGAQHGVAIQEIRGIKKMIFGKQSGVDVGDLVDHGVFTIFTAGVADA
jgi:N4-gp56 family major capsid protein